MSAVTDQITEVLRKHGGASLRCFLPCGYQAHSRDDMAAHVAERVEEALQLAEEWAATGDWRDGQVYSLIDGSRGSRENAERHKYYDSIDVISRWVSKWQIAS